jgi:hypothetical protein
MNSMTLLLLYKKVMESVALDEQCIQGVFGPAMHALVLCLIFVQHYSRGAI